MVSRKRRTPVVVDTNVFVRGLKTRSNANPNRRVLRLWLIERRLQLTVCRELIDEYLAVFEEVLNMDDEILAEWRNRFESDERVTLVKLGSRPVLSRDPDDDVLLATAISGRVEFLVSNDRDLLELPEATKRSLKYEVLTPLEFLTFIDTPA